MTRSSFAVALFSFLVTSQWLAAGAEIEIPLSSHGGLFSVDDAGVPGFVTTVTVIDPPPQPQCWVEALKIFQPKNGDEMATTSKVCERMGPIHQKALAFELARCHLQDLGRAMIVQAAENEPYEDPQQCAAFVRKDGGSDHDDDAHQFPNLSRCLTSLTQSGANSYSLFFAQVVQLCNRLTLHLASDFQHRTAMKLARVSQNVVQQFTNIIQAQQENFQTLEDEIRKRHESFYAAMQDQQERLWEGQTSRFDEFKAWTASLMEQKQQDEAWLRNQTLLLGKLTKEFEREHLQKLFAAVEFLQPLATVQTWLSMAKYAIKALVTALYSVVAIGLVRLVTIPRRCRGPRPFLLGLVVLEGMAAQVLCYAEHYGSFFDSHHHLMLSRIRPVSFCVATLVYLIGVIISCCCCCCFGDDNEDDEERGSDNSDQDGEENEPPRSRSSRPIVTTVGKTHHIQFRDFRELEEARYKYDRPNSVDRATLGTSFLPRGAVPLEEVNVPTSRLRDSATFRTASSRAVIVSSIPRDMTLMNGREAVIAALTSTRAGLRVDVGRTGHHLTLNGVPTASPLTTTTSAAAVKSEVTQFRGSHKRPSDEDEGAQETHPDTKRRRVEEPKMKLEHGANTDEGYHTAMEEEKEGENRANEDSTDEDSTDEDYDDGEEETEDDDSTMDEEMEGFIE